jgi:hypothetical protein
MTLTAADAKQKPAWDEEMIPRLVSTLDVGPRSPPTLDDADNADDGDATPSSRGRFTLGDEPSPTANGFRFQGSVAITAGKSLYYDSPPALNVGRFRFLGPRREAGNGATLVPNPR